MKKLQEMVKEVYENIKVEIGNLNEKDILVYSALTGASLASYLSHFLRWDLIAHYTRGFIVESVVSKPFECNKRNNLKKYSLYLSLPFLISIGWEILELGIGWGKFDKEDIIIESLGIFSSLFSNFAKKLYEE